MRRSEIDTPTGIAVVHLLVASEGRGLLVLGHGAGGGVTAPDLTAAAAAGQGAGFHIALVEQPYRVAGRKAPPRAPTLDAAWVEVVARVREEVMPQDGCLVVGGRSSGARVACRTAQVTGAAGVLCLAFPLQPARREGRPAAPSRLPELDGVTVPVLVVQGDRDPFGSPSATASRRVVRVAGDHSLRTALDIVAEVTGRWLRELAGADEAAALRVDGDPGGGRSPSF